MYGHRERGHSNLYGKSELGYVKLYGESGPGMDLAIEIRMDIMRMAIPIWMTSVNPAIQTCIESASWLFESVWKTCTCFISYGKSGPGHLKMSWKCEPSSLNLYGRHEPGYFNLYRKNEPCDFNHYGKLDPVMRLCTEKVSWLFECVWKTYELAILICMQRVDLVI